MSAEFLREAAAAMRERAEACMSGFEAEVAVSWYGQPNCIAKALRGEYGPGGIYDADAEHITSWPPVVALAVADWLDLLSSDLESVGVAASVDHPAFKVAAAYLGRQP